MQGLRKLSKLLREQLPEDELNAVLLQLSVEGLTDERLLRWICQNNFLAFCMAVKPDFIPTRFHAHLAGRLQKFYENVKTGKDERICLSCPPQIGKSTLASVLFPAWILGKESWPIVVASYGASLAERKSQEARDTLEEPMYQIIFPGVKLHPDSTSKEFWRTTKKGGSYRAVGVGGGLTGMSGKILICDDPFSGRAEADSEVIRDSTWAWFKTVFYTRKQSKSGIVLINTRWHLDDVEGRLIEEEENAVAARLPVSEYDTWEHFKFPAIAEEDEYIDGQLFRRKGEVLAPERFTLEDMIKTRNAMSVEDWAALYQQSPILSENQEFRSEWFKYFEEKDIKDKKLDIFALYDPAISQKKSADNSCITTLGKERTSPEIYRLDEKAGRFDPGTAIDYIFHLKDRFKDRKFVLGLETVAFQKALHYMIHEEMRKREVYFEIVEIKSTGSSKEDRIRGLIALYKTGIIYHRKGVDKEYEIELMQFPKGKHDDRIDAMSMFLQVGKPTQYNGLGATRYVPKSTTYGGRRIN